MHHSSINKVHTSLLASALKKNGSQIIPFALVLSGAHAKFVITNLLNSNEMKDYLLLERKWQLVRGNFIFKTLSVNNIILRNELNNIHMDDIVIISSSQNITGYKTFNFLSSNSVTTNGYVNQMNISNFKCIYNDDAEFLMMLNFTSDVVINNIKLQSLNGLNLTHMTVNSVKYSENQIIKGLKVFTQVTIIEQNLSILGSLNEIELDNFMTLHTQQNIYKKVDFLNVAFKEIKTHSVNNIDLHKEAIQKSGNFKVEDTMTFLQSLEANDIILKDGVTIDTMDPSTEAYFITAIDHIFNDSLEFSNIRVLNNMEIEDIRVKTLLNKLVNNTWQKTKPQNVQYGPINIFKYLNATSMEVNRLNGILLKDIVTCKEIAAINSSKHFENVQVRSLSLQGGKTINDIDFTSRSLILLLEKKLKSFCCSKHVS
ncbi:uncharacterized protein CEXT_362291 [Caerostris extrusa]|uniref:Uncharacterized protein n=1 Tax=Caerostris extrusa TaxID=172846 RepID=A0AAV4RI97_CAEEX|nr:uncharacterized protein CEXT_362291 [Caerostris extrusa]